MSKSNRDDFSPAVKRLAAQRTGYRCSLCSISTIGPSSESNFSTASIGEASHICAAAPKGKRYDPNMTPKERASIDNCIWMCKIHARVIDRDDVKYTVPVLKELKKKAEKYAEESISEVDIFRNEYNTSGDDISSLREHFCQMIKSGNFDLLRNILENYNCTISSAYDEFVLRFKLTYDLYCNQSMIGGHLEEYLKLPNQAGADDLLEIAIPFNQVNVVEKLLPFAMNEDNKRMAQMLIEGKLECALIGSKDSYEPFTVSKEKHDLVNSYVVHRAIDENIFRLQTVDGGEVELKSEEAYNKLLFAAYRLVGKIIYNNASILSTPKDCDYWELKQNINIINQLDAKLQDFLWEAILQFTLNDREQFCELEDKLSLCAHEMPRITRACWLYKILCEIKLVDIDKLLAYSSEHNNYRLLSMYLWQIPENERYEFIKDHLFLCKKSSRFLQMILEYEEMHNLNTIQLSDYEAIFECDFLYMCLKYKTSSTTEQRKEIVDWLLEHQDLLLTEDLHLYLDILHSEDKFDNILEISTKNINEEHLFHIAHLLTNSSGETYNKKAIQIYEELEEKGWAHQNLFFNIAVVSAKAGKVEKAKKYFQREYDTYNSDNALFHLLQLRIETNDVHDDEYLHKAKSIVTRDFQNIVAASYDKLMNHREAKLYVLRTLLIDETAGCIGALFSLNLEEENDDELEFVQNECVCVLQSKANKINVAIHNEEVIRGIKPNNFADCMHFSAGDASIAPLMYRKKEDIVQLLGENYKIIDIQSASSFFASYSLHQIVSKNDGVQTIRASTPEEAITNITACLMETKSKTDSILNEYNSSQIRYPISILSSILGKDCIDVCEFIALANSEKVRNNQDYAINEGGCSYILSFDSIVNLALVSSQDMLPKNARILCSRQVKNHLLGEISKTIDDLNSKKSKGTMYLIDDKARFSERTLEFKQNRYAFLTSIKSLVDALPEVEAFDFESPNSDLECLFIDRKMDIESGTLALLQNTPNSVLITDDQFLYAIARMMGYNSIGLCGFLASTCQDSMQLIEVSKKLKSINFGNYMPLFLFDKIVACLTDVKTQEECDKATDALTKWLMSDREDEEATDYHREVILQLYRDCTRQAGAPLSTEYPLTQIAIHHFKKLNPEYVKKMIADLSKNITIKVVDEVKASENHNS